MRVTPRRSGAAAVVLVMYRLMTFYTRTLGTRLLARASPST